VLLAGVDVGNSTTEVAVARVEPGREPEWLLVLRRETTGAKGSVECAVGVAELLERAARRLGEPPHELALAELHPVEAGLVELGRLEELELGRAAVARPASATPSGVGVGVGILHRLPDLAGTPDRGAVLAVVCEEEFEVAAAALRGARERGWRIAGAIVKADDAVLIGNRFDRGIPIVDEVEDASELPTGVLAAIEVSPPGQEVAELADPLRIAVLLGLSPAEARAARVAARAVAGHRAAIVLRQRSDDGGSAQARPGQQPPITLVTKAGEEMALDERADPPPPGAIAAIRGAAGDHERILDVFWRTLPAPPDDAGFTRRLVRRRAIAIAVLAEGDASGLLDALGELAPRGARVVAAESTAAVLGASTTPGAGRAPFVLDLVGGTVDLHREGAGAVHVVSTAGAGELVTRVCAALLSCDRATAERAKRSHAARVETPFTLHHEDGSRGFIGEPAPPATLSRLCLLDGRALVPLPAPLAPEVWRMLRRAAKREVIARNVRRALDTAGGVPAGELVTLVGGSACDPEVVDSVAAELADLDVAVARGDVLGRHGPRAAVAVGLVLAAASRG
jgi:Diol dehydratase reactivase ATPase-like domain/DD-reactivating factor swiveling domain